MKTGRIATRDDDVQPPKTAATQSLWMSFVGLLGEDRRLGRAVLLDDLELLAQDAALGVDLLGGEAERVRDGLLTDRHGAGERVEEPDLDGVATGVDARLGVAGAAFFACLGTATRGGRHTQKNDGSNRCKAARIEVHGTGFPSRTAAGSGSLRTCIPRAAAPLPRGMHPNGRNLGTGCFIHMTLQSRLTTSRWKELAGGLSGSAQDH